MTNQNLSQKIKELRIKKNLSQESLSDLSGLSLRTIQRIEKNTVTPTAYSISKLSIAFNEDITKLIDKDVQRNNQSLKLLYLSSLSFIIFPLLGAVAPAVIWIWKKDQFKGKEKLIKSLINFQLTWCIIFLLTPIFIIPIVYPILDIVLEMIEQIINFNFNLYFHQGSWDQIFVWALLYIFNIFVILKNTLFVDQESKINLPPKMIFIK